MDYTLSILVVNSSCIVMLIVLAVILLVATRFKSEGGYAAAIIVLPTVPVYLYNISRMLGWFDIAPTMFVVAFAVNTLQMPLLWFFTKRNFVGDFRLRFGQMWHLIPAVAFLVLGWSMSPEERMWHINQEILGRDTWVGNINSSLVFVQMVAYFFAIFRLLVRSRRMVGDYQSDAEWVQKAWIFNFMVLYCVLFVLVMVFYVLWPRTDAWLIQIFNLVGMSYLVYNGIRHPLNVKLYFPDPAAIVAETEAAGGNIGELREDVAETDGGEAAPLLSEGQMKELCDKARAHLTATRSFLGADLTLAALARDMKVSARYLSRSINAYLNKNFFEFINEMRVEEAKRRLMELDSTGFNIDSIYSECGFRSRSTFYMVFKKTTGFTPAAWLAAHRAKSE